MSSEVFEFGRTYESEISRIEEENEPFSFKLSQTCLLESVFMEHFEGKVRDFLTDEREFVFTASPAATHIILHKTRFSFLEVIVEYRPCFFLSNVPEESVFFRDIMIENLELSRRMNYI